MVVFVLFCFLWRFDVCCCFFWGGMFVMLCLFCSFCCSPCKIYIIHQGFNVLSQKRNVRTLGLKTNKLTKNAPSLKHEIAASYRCLMQ